MKGAMRTIGVFLIWGWAFLVWAQQRLVVIEYFTNASCGPCAIYGPPVHSTVKANSNKVVYLEYHTNWPGYDPMNQHNPTEVSARVSYYGVIGVPHAVMDGNYLNDHPAIVVTQSNINTRYGVSSPLNLNLTHTITPAGDSIYVTLEIIPVDTVIAGAPGKLKARIAVIEREIKFLTPPGTNGETDFLHVMKKMLPNANGITLSDTLYPGDTIRITQSWKLQNIYNLGEVGAVAFIQDDQNKAIHNGAYSAPNLPFTMHLVPAGNWARIRPLNDSATVRLDLNVTTSISNTFRVYLDKSTLPAGWSANLYINGNTYSDSADLTIASTSVQSIFVKVNTGSSGGKVMPKVTVKSLGAYPTYVVTGEGAVVAGAEHLLVNYNTAYKNTLDLMFSGAGRTKQEMTEGEFKAVPATDIHPSIVPKIIIFTSNASQNLFTASQITAFENFLNSGGKIYFAGEDIGYWKNSGAPFSFQLFYATYLGAQYISDQASSNSINSVPGEMVFNQNGVTSFSLSSGTTYYSDVISATNNAVPVFYYGTNQGAHAGCRVEDPTIGWKVMYHAFRVERVTPSATRDRLLKLTLDWFDGLITSKELDKAMQALTIGTPYPNPAMDILSIPVSNAKNDLLLQLYSVDGKLVRSERFPAGTNLIQLEVSTLSPGIYSYTVSEVEHQRVTLRKADQILIAR